MTAEQLSPTHENAKDEVRLSIVEAGEELATRAVPRIVEWGPTHHRSDYETPETPHPDGLTYSA